ncbi:hypothetical protein DICPUDRAFT_21681, partial [Dictyostelium purpureum]
SSISAETNNKECALCGFVIDYVKGQLLKNKTETYILDKLEKVCLLVPAPLQPTCRLLVTLYGVPAIKMASSKVNTTVLCELVDLCPTPTPTPTKTVQNVQVGDTKCTICDFVVGEVEKYLSGNATEAQIITFLNKDCKIFGAFGTTCQSLVQAYVPTIINLLENNQSPDTVCAEIKLCTSRLSKKV